MESLTASEARANLFGLVEQVNKDHTPREIISRKGNAVLLSKADWDSLQETLYLQAIPGLVQSVKAAAQDDDWVPEEEFLEYLDGVDDSV
ncbi:MAG: type II toxin-antitoxin system Phd/YefM family antitoxin [Nodosilinea sp.]